MKLTNKLMNKSKLNKTKSKNEIEIEMEIQTKHSAQTQNIPVLSQW